MTIVKTPSVFKMQCFNSTMGIRGEVQRKYNNLFVVFLKKQQILTMLIKHTWYYVHIKTQSSVECLATAADIHSTVK